jgi:hypothetical protein
MSGISSPILPPGPCPLRARASVNFDPPGIGTCKLRAEAVEPAHAADRPPWGRRPARSTLVESHAKGAGQIP